MCANWMSNGRGKSMQILTDNGEKFAFKLAVDMIQYTLQNPILVFCRVDNCHSGETHLLFWRQN